VAGVVLFARQRLRKTDFAALFAFNASATERNNALMMCRVEDGRYFAQCSECGAWHEVQPHNSGSETYFAHRQAAFSCCGREQQAIFIVEKDELDFH
jgi:hypothetical protein